MIVAVEWILLVVACVASFVVGIRFRHLERDALEQLERTRRVLDVLERPHPDERVRRVPRVYDWARSELQRDDVERDWIPFDDVDLEEPER